MHQITLSILILGVSCHFPSELSTPVVYELCISKKNIYEEKSYKTNLFVLHCCANKIWTTGNWAKWYYLNLENWSEESRVTYACVTTIIIFIFMLNSYMKFHVACSYLTFFSFIWLRRFFKWYIFLFILNKTQITLKYTPQIGTMVVIKWHVSVCFFSFSDKSDENNCTINQFTWKTEHPDPAVTTQHVLMKCNTNGIITLSINIYYRMVIQSYLFETWLWPLYTYISNLCRYCGRSLLPVCHSERITMGYWHYGALVW